VRELKPEILHIEENSQIKIAKSSNPVPNNLLKFSALTDEGP
jgi:hypothetical protein